MPKHPFKWLRSFLPTFSRKRVTARTLRLLIEEFACDGADIEKIQRRIKENGIHINTKDKNGRTLLHYAAKLVDDPKVHRGLLECRAKVNAKDSEGQTPFHFAAASNPNAEVLKVLIEFKANIKAKDHAGRTAWNHAATNGSPEVHSLLAILFG